MTEQKVKDLISVLPYKSKRPYLARV